MFRFTDAQAKIIGGLYGSENMSDIKIKLEDEKHLHAHKFLLYVNSEYFRGMFDAPMSESSLGIVDMSGYSANHVALCIKSMYNPTEAINEIKEITEKDESSAEYGHILNLVNYLGLGKLQYIMEEIAIKNFVKLLTIPYNVVNIIELILYGSGERKSNLAYNMMAHLRVSLSKEAVEEDKEYANYMLAGNRGQELGKILKLSGSMLGGAKEDTAVSIFRIWVERYNRRRADDEGAAIKEFDEWMSKGIVDISLLPVHNEWVRKDIAEVKNTLTYGFIVNLKGKEAIFSKK
jgi:hypothetical protein